jgi:hypothetical protein
MKFILLFLSVSSFSFAQKANLIDTFSYSNIKNIIALEPTDILTGNYVLTFERKFSSKFSLEIGAGITGRNFYYNHLNRNADSNVRHWHYVDSLSWSGNISAKSYKTPTNARKYNIGFSVQVTPKFYFNNKGLLGKYIGIRAEYALYSSTAPAIGIEGKLDTVISNFKPESLHKINLTAIYGDNIMMKRLSIGYYIGFGATYINESTAGYYQIYNDFGGYDHHNGMIKREGIYPQAVAGVKLGFGF